MPLVEQRQQRGLSAAAPQTWGDAALSFGKHVAGLPMAMLQGAWDAVTLPGRAYRGEVPQDQMLPEAFNFAGNVALGGYMAPKPAGALGMSGGGKGIKAYHGSPHDFDRFSMDKIGTGEGAQAYGHGLYFAENEGVARSYRDVLGNYTDSVKWKGDKPPTPTQQSLLNRLSGADAQAGVAMDVPRLKREISMMIRDAEHGMFPDAKRAAEYRAELDELKRIEPLIEISPPGRLYEVRINAEPEQFLDWDKPLSQQSEAVQKAVREHPSLSGYKDLGAWNDTEMSYFRDVIGLQSPEDVSRLRDAGIPGIRYLDQGSRTAGEGSRNYVVFDDSLIEILRKYGLAGMIGGGGAAFGMGYMQPQAQQSQEPWY